MPCAYCAAMPEFPHRSWCKEVNVEEAVGAIRSRDDVMTMVKGLLERIESLKEANDTWVALYGPAPQPIAGPNVQTTEFEDNSGTDLPWHKVQDQIDAWAQRTLPSEHACAIMSWSDRLAQHLSDNFPGETNHNAIIQAIDPFTRGAFTGWKGKTGASTITLDEAEDHFSLCMADMMDAARTAAQIIPGQPQQPAETVAAGAIIDIMSGGKLDWRSRIDEGDFLESADWQNALAYARAALSCAQPQTAPERASLRQCSYCKTWNSKPCGEQCCWSPTDPVYMPNNEAGGQS